eukprot:scaffold118821_cov35-Tisochrysis_lutea.AAC.4
MVVDEPEEEVPISRPNISLRSSKPDNLGPDGPSGPGRPKRDPASVGLGLGVGGCLSVEGGALRQAQRIWRASEELSGIKGEGCLRYAAAAGKLS